MAGTEQEWIMRSCALGAVMKPLLPSVTGIVQTMPRTMLLSVGKVWIQGYRDTRRWHVLKCRRRDKYLLA